MNRPYTMRDARRRFQIERLTETAHAPSFRRWAKKTYGPGACAGKLRQVVGRRG